MPLRLCHVFFLYQTILYYPVVAVNSDNNGRVLATAVCVWVCVCMSVYRDREGMRSVCVLLLMVD